MTEALLEIRELAAQFAAGRLRPEAEGWDRGRAYDAAVITELDELGFAGLLVPESSGGLGLGAPTLVAVVEEIAWGEPAVALLLGVTASLAAMIADSTAADVLAGIASGEFGVWTQLSHEARHSPAVTAVRDGDGWRLDGQASWVLDAGAGGVLPLVTEPGPGLFLVPVGADGFEVRDRIDTVGLRSARIVSVALEGVRVPATARIAADDAVGAMLVRGEMFERLVVAAMAVGTARAALEHARDYADTREQFGRRLRQFEGIRVKLADMSARVAASAALVAEAAASPSPAAVAQAKILASESAMRVTTDAVQVFGGYGYMRDYPVEKLMREAKATELLMGTNDELRSLVVNAMYAN
ncbi:MAG: acyl-CoA dehydrogenase family protein [Gemmatimonadota bacterium]|jgi:alkylation response protein AidB-like acyl-CoA dehydrogenase